MTNLPAVLSNLKQEIGVLTEKLEPARPNFIAECLDMLKSGGMMVPKGIAPADFIREYTLAISGVPVCGLMVAVAKLKRGEYQDIKPDFMPLPALLAAIARLEAKTVRDDLIRLREKQSTLEDNSKPREKTDERQMARIRDMYAQFKAAHAESKVGARFGAVEAEMTDEQAEYWSRIQELRDAPNISEEQRAMRRKIAASVPQKQREAAE